MPDSYAKITEFAAKNHDMLREIFCYRTVHSLVSSIKEMLCNINVLNMQKLSFKIKEFFTKYFILMNISFSFKTIKQTDCENLNNRTVKIELCKCIN